MTASVGPEPNVMGLPMHVVVVVVVAVAVAVAVAVVVVVVVVVGLHNCRLTAAMFFATES